MYVPHQHLDLLFHQWYVIPPCAFCSGSFKEVTQIRWCTHIISSVTWKNLGKTKKICLSTTSPMAFSQLWQATQTPLQRTSPLSCVCCWLHTYKGKDGFPLLLNTTHCSRASIGFIALQTVTELPINLWSHDPKHNAGSRSQDVGSRTMGHRHPALRFNQ